MPTRLHLLIIALARTNEPIGMVIVCIFSFKQEAKRNVNSKSIQKDDHLDIYITLPFINQTSLWKY